MPMALKVLDLLSLPLLREGRVIAGAGGLSRQVRAVSFTDCPIVFSEEEYALTAKGDLYIFGYAPYRTELPKLLDRIRFYIRTRSSCCIVMIENLDEFPAEAAELADQSGYPIILLSDRIAYADVIRAVTEAIYLSEASAAMEKRADSLLYDPVSQAESADLAKHFFSFRQAVYGVCFLSAREAESRRGDLERELTSRLSRREVSLHLFRGQLFWAVGMDAPEELNALSSLLPTVAAGLFSDARMGVSAPHRGAGEFAQAMREAFQSCRISACRNRPVTCFGQEPYWELLYDLRHHPALARFCRETLRPLREYQEGHGVDLVETLRIFFQEDGSYKRTAAALFQHENTVRFRVNKAKNLLGMEEDSCRFTKEVSLAIDCLSFLSESS